MSRNEIVERLCRFLEQRFKLTSGSLFRQSDFTHLNIYVVATECAAEFSPPLCDFDIYDEEIEKIKTIEQLAALIESKLKEVSL